MNSHKIRHHNSLLKVQGIYYLLTGIWPVLSMETFLWVTGPKSDLWLVIVVGTLITVNGATFIYSSLFQKRNIAVGFLAAVMALALAILEILFYAQGIISPVYLLDATLELCLFIVWIAIFRMKTEVRF
tara:strand:+ start:532 stop:918 length:387 start_codon:yes stop_codon:yes gene_type:complete